MTHPVSLALARFCPSRMFRRIAPRLLLAQLTLAQLTLASAMAGAAEPLRLVTLGDSITKGVRTGVQPSETFATLVGQALERHGLRVEVTNVGIGGERTDQAVKRLERDVLALRPHLVTIMYGTNDSYVDAGKSSSRITREEYQRHLTSLVTSLRQAGVQVILMTEPAWAEGSGPNGLGEDPNVRLGPFMEACRDVARQTSTPLVDHYAHWTACRVKGQLLRPWTTDGCHPNPRGHEELAHRIVPVILPLACRLADELEAWRADAPFRLRLDVVTRGYDGHTCWVHPRAGAIPAEPPQVVLTLQQLLLTGSDVFYELNELRSDDAGVTWNPLRKHEETLGRRDEGDGVIVAACDFTPKWHAASGKLLGIGHTVRYRDNHVIAERKRETCYAVYDAERRTWTPWTTLELPDEAKFYNAGAGSVQRVDLPNGDILLPIYFRGKGEPYYRVTVLRLAFDGQKLTFLEQGNELSLAAGRGVYEPSLTRFQNRFYLTLRNDTAGYVSSSDDGLQFAEPRAWTWDDGSPLGNYNTQQHWVTHSDGLYLAYTRRGLGNDHVFRHRAPLLLARVDPATLRIERATEQIVVPERGARLGNFGVVEVSANETWITVAEWMQTWGPDIVIRPDNIYGADNSVYAARLRWRTPNTSWNQR